jgi:hypothetical protein
MSILLAITLTLATTATTATAPECAWDRAARAPYTGSASATTTAAAAIDRYTDLPPAVRNQLKLRLAQGKPDEVVAITRDAIHGQHHQYHYGPALRDVQLDGARICATLGRSQWLAERVETGAVYCAGDSCVLVAAAPGNPRVGQVSRRLVIQPHHQVGQHELGLLDAPEQTDPDGDEGSHYLARAVASPALAALDPVVVAAVPEPHTWAMLAGGLGLVAAMARRQRRRTATAPRAG